MDEVRSCHQSLKEDLAEQLNELHERLRLSHEELHQNHEAHREHTRKCHEDWEAAHAAHAEAHHERLGQSHDHHVGALEAAHAKFDALHQAHRDHAQSAVAAAEALAHGHITRTHSELFESFEAAEALAHDHHHRSLTHASEKADAAHARAEAYHAEHMDMVRDIEAVVDQRLRQHASEHMAAVQAVEDMFKEAHAGHVDTSHAKAAQALEFMEALVEERLRTGHDETEEHLRRGQKEALAEVNRVVQGLEKAVEQQMRKAADSAEAMGQRCKADLATHSEAVHRSSKLVKQKTEETEATVHHSLKMSREETHATVDLRLKQSQAESARILQSMEATMEQRLRQNRAETVEAISKAEAVVDQRLRQSLADTASTVQGVEAVVEQQLRLSRSEAAEAALSQDTLVEQRLRRASNEASAAVRTVETVVEERLRRSSAEATTSAEALEAHVEQRLRRGRSEIAEAVEAAATTVDQCIRHSRLEVTKAIDAAEAVRTTVERRLSDGLSEGRREASEEIASMMDKLHSKTLDLLDDETVATDNLRGQVSSLNRELSELCEAQRGLRVQVGREVSDLRSSQDTTEAELKILLSELRTGETRHGDELGSIQEAVQRLRRQLGSETEVSIAGSGLGLAKADLTHAQRLAALEEETRGLARRGEAGHARAADMAVAVERLTQETAQSNCRAEALANRAGEEARQANDRVEATLRRSHEELVQEQQSARRSADDHAQRLAVLERSMHQELADERAALRRELAGAASSTRVHEIAAQLDDLAQNVRQGSVKAEVRELRAELSEQVKRSTLVERNPSPTLEVERRIRASLKNGESRMDELATLVERLQRDVREQCRRSDSADVVELCVRRVQEEVTRRVQEAQRLCDMRLDGATRNAEQLRTADAAQRSELWRELRDLRVVVNELRARSTVGSNGANGGIPGLGGTYAERDGSIGKVCSPGGISFADDLSGQRRMLI
eukprot:gnl/TRDRNA2_/TRDRNA2_168946_c0_seq1.p1 gnl/TRDRNA2_/TRDRNA2_168946_c0~~gnl/TRDRNA2_/TRDRNA2_168946_c0_seq1.p1  ORF type:complete len:1134 (+),score=276.36 gnl/TRDRNA2_/TRDRNA2_168946_c0_seq1:508-3402(+)